MVILPDSNNIFTIIDLYLDALVLFRSLPKMGLSGRS